MLETVIPRSEPGYVMIVQGKYSGEVSKKYIKESFSYYSNF